MTRRAARLVGCVAVLVACIGAAADETLPQLTAPVNDFAGVVDEPHKAEMDRMIRALQARTGDAVVVATIRTFAPYADIREYAVKMFENGGRGIGEKGKDNGLLVLLAVDDRRVWVEVGYDLEGIITDGFAGETSRQAMAPRFRQGEYGAGLAEGVRRLVGRIAQERNVTLDGVPVPQPSGGQDISLSPGAILALIVLALVIFRVLGAMNRFNRPRGWGRRRTWSGWHSGVGPFGGGFGGGWGSGGGGFGGGFGGFGGGRSGGGGGGASW
jgi:uncharacterized protein